MPKYRIAGARIISSQPPTAWHPRIASALNTTVPYDGSWDMRALRQAGLRRTDPGWPDGVMKYQMMFIVIGARLEDLTE